METRQSQKHEHKSKQGAKVLQEKNNLIIKYAAKTLH